jgi:hypothetical protein
LEGGASSSSYFFPYRQSRAAPSSYALLPAGALPYGRESASSKSTERKKERKEKKREREREREKESVAEME